jgi:carotenoid cleavage dioxygenase-like enzyme
MRGLLKKGETLTAHPRVDAKNDRLIAFSDKKVCVNVYIYVYIHALDRYMCIHI